MSDDAGGPPPDKPWIDDPFSEGDPEARERARRRAEREARRAKREGKSAGGEPAPPGPSAGERASAALSGLTGRISRRRGESEEPVNPPPAELPPPEPPLDSATPLEGEPAPFDFGEPEPQAGFDPEGRSEAPQPEGSDPSPDPPPEPYPEEPDTGYTDETEIVPPRQVSEPERYSHSTPPPSRGGVRGRLPRARLRALWIVLAIFASPSCCSQTRSSSRSTAAARARSSSP